MGNILKTVGAALLNPTAVLGTLAAGGADMLGALYQNKENKKAATEAYNRELSILQYQNAYNTPAAQMERYKEAGLNPNLIYGQSNLSASASSVPQQHAAAGPRLNMLSAIKLGQDLQLGQEQIEQVRNVKRLVSAQVDKVNAETDLIRHELDITPTGVSTKDHSTVGQAARILKAVNDGLDTKSLDTKRHSHNPNLPALGRNYKP